VVPGSRRLVSRQLARASWAAGMPYRLAMLSRVSSVWTVMGNQPAGAGQTEGGGGSTWPESVCSTAGEVWVIISGARVTWGGGDSAGMVGEGRKARR
jgi:hypothetical protein